MTDFDDVLKKAGLEGLDMAKVEEHVVRGGLLGVPCMKCAIKLIKIRDLLTDVVKHSEEK